MKRCFHILLFLSIFAVTAEKALADQASVPAGVTPSNSNGASVESSQSSDQTAAPQSDKNSPSAKSSQNNASLPLRVTSLLAGIVIGAPVASFRRAIGEDSEAAETVTYGKKHSGLKFAARVVLLPVCLLPGAIEGVSYAVENSCKYCGTAPLSKQSFSLGKLGPSEK
ncbi:MAG: hypothetical protein C0469_07855 [Cyanobacteria bacterium DS2.3.42]|nr:hypothetical protein [Cyanobacteria bacterium DS2.3.42]